MKQAMSNSKPQMLTLPQLIKMEMLPARATRRVIDEGRVKSIKIGTRRYVCLETFLRYLENGESEV